MCVCYFWYCACLVIIIILQATARRDAKGIWMFDCWPVHCSLEFREWVKVACPGFEHMYIPYGRTGDFQINYVYWHKSLKDAQTAAAASWHLHKLRSWRAEVKEGTITTMELLARMRKLMALGKLREQSPVWLRKGVEALLRVNVATGTNLLRQGWVSLVKAYPFA